jgi:molybdenum cofactor cytidylyltransferase
MPAAPVVIVLAAGRGERFAASGGTTHKLRALLAGVSVLDHTLAAVKASGLAFHVVASDPSRPGMGDSIAAGVRATPDASCWLILPADLPLVRAQTLRTIAFAAPQVVTVPVYQGQRGHPVRFDASCKRELLSFKGNKGAAQLMRAQEAINLVAEVEVGDEGVITDIDTLDDLLRAQTLLSSRLL